MATQAKEMKTRMASLPNQYSGFEKTLSGFEKPHGGFEKTRSGFENPHSGFGEKPHSEFDENLQIVIAVKLMVKMKNLFRLKDGLGPCLEDAYDKQHLPLHNKL
jgi:hypothetical protein